MKRIVKTRIYDKSSLHPAREDDRLGRVLSGVSDLVLSPYGTFIFLSGGKGKGMGRKYNFLPYLFRLIRNSVRVVMYFSAIRSRREEASFYGSKSVHAREI